MKTTDYTDLPDTLLPESLIHGQKESKCHLDLILIYSERNRDWLVGALPLADLKKSAFDFSVEWSTGDYRDYGWKTRMRVISLFLGL